MQETKEFNDEITDEDCENLRQLLLDTKLFRQLLIESGCSLTEADMEIKKSEYLVGIWDLKNQAKLKINDLRKKFNGELNNNKNAISEVSVNNQMLSKRINEIDEKVTISEKIFLMISGSDRSALEEKVIFLEKDSHKMYRELETILMENQELKYRLEKEREKAMCFEHMNTELINQIEQLCDKNIEQKEKTKQENQYSKQNLSQMFIPVTKLNSLSEQEILRQSSVCQIDFVSSTETNNNLITSTELVENSPSSENKESYSSLKI